MFIEKIKQEIKFFLKFEMEHPQKKGPGYLGLAPKKT